MPEEGRVATKLLPIWFAAVLAFGAVALAFTIGTDPAGELLLAARWTARVSFPVFILTYCASSLVRLWPNDLWKTILRHRRQWGLGFALAHTVHLAALAWYNIAIQHMPAAQTLLGGGLAYALMFAMALTSNDASMRRLGMWWKRLHTAGIHWIWFIFAFSYFGRLFDPERMVQGAILFPVCVAALGLRIAARRKARQPIAV
jgi:DMSO/TMAO reductase YedYZ heme-binding membrane subunit